MSYQSRTKYASISRVWNSNGSSSRRHKYHADQFHESMAQLLPTRVDKTSPKKQKPIHLYWRERGRPYNTFSALIVVCVGDGQGKCRSNNTSTTCTNSTGSSDRYPNKPVFLISSSVAHVFLWRFKMATLRSRRRWIKPIDSPPPTPT